ncbi:hypothetical protein At1g04090-like [Apium graveolens]|uniref:hypothetical protein At1g04090-like n=1 Tax=Apium graveolens TaxID=4045 RepID=UPI003D78C72A
MGNFVSAPAFIFKKQKKRLPIETTFALPSPIPTWSSGEGFASGTIDLGGLQVCQLTTFNKIWASHEGGPDNLGATIYEPSSVPEGFTMLGCYGQANNESLFGFVLAAKETDPESDILKMPTDYKLVWSSETSKLKQDGVAYVWLPMPPDGYKTAGHVVTSSSDKPSLEKIRCVRADFTVDSETEDWIWGQAKDLNVNGFNLYAMRPKERGAQALGVSVGTFVAQNGGGDGSLCCLKNVEANLSAMPNLNQVREVFQAYSPYVYFHPDEKYFPSTVNWYFQNGALLFSKGNESSPTPIEPMGANLPQGGSNDGTFWLGLPNDKNASDKIKKGDLQDAMAYLHIKPMFGASYTDIAIWLFYPFNGPARAKIEIINISLGKIGEHVSDWEHVTLRISNFNGELRSVYFSEHSKGQWVSAPHLEFENGNKPVTYSSLNGHAFYPKPGLVLQGSGGIGIRNDTAKSKNVMVTGNRFSIVAGDYLKSSGIVEPPWLNYLRKWGPNITYDIAEELKKVEKVLPGFLKKAFIKLVKNLPSEVLGEDGPTGPKVKTNWTGDESV